MQIKCVVGPLLRTNMYILEQNGRAVVIDPCIAPEALRETQVDLIILTHEHYDHICGVNAWVEAYGCPVCCGQAAVEGLRDPRVNMSHYGNTFFEVLGGQKIGRELGEIGDYTCKADRQLGDGETFRWEDCELRVIETPGHSAGGICILVNEEILFCGDTLLAEEPTGVNGRGGNARQFKEITLPKLKTLNPDVTAYPGHGPVFRLKDYRFWE